MLKKALRLKTKEDFERVFRKGKPLFFGVIACKIAPNTLGHIRVGFSFGKKHISKAVARNRARRVLSEAFSRRSQVAGDRFPYDIAFFSVKRVSKEHFKDFASVGESVVKCIYK
ncbi:MAG: ribonuclease P protein component [Candidatus Moranbacteria bacterium]|nr:ribonuclease P protein component [Candidatus Moranbacteria bacterium]